MVVASMPRQAPHGSDELAAADDAPRSEHNGTVPVLHTTNPEMPFWGKGDWNSFFLLSFDNLSALISILAGLLSIPHRRGARGPKNGPRRAARRGGDSPAGT